MDVDPMLAEGTCYAIFPMHLHAGEVASVEGLEDLGCDARFVAATAVHGVGDEILEWGSAQQVFAYLHFRADDVLGLVNAMKKAVLSLSVKDRDGREMLFSLFDPFDESSYPLFLEGRMEAM